MDPKQLPFIYLATFRSPWDANEVYLRENLNAQRALGLILNKRLWWTAWATVPSAREEWLREIEVFLVRLNIRQMLAMLSTQNTVNWSDLQQAVSTAVALPVGSKERHVAVDKLFNDMAHRIQTSGLLVAATPGFDVESTDDRCRSAIASVCSSDEDMSVEGEHDSEDDAMLDDDDNVVTFDVAWQQAREWFGFRGIDIGDEDGERGDNMDMEESDVEGQEAENPFGQIAWFADVVAKYEKLLRLTDEAALRGTWWRDVQASETTLERAVGLILAMLRADEDRAIETLRSLVPAATKGESLEFLLTYIQAIRELVEETKQDISTTLGIIVQHLELDSTNANRCVHTPGPAPLTWMSDTSVASDLQTKICSEISTLRESVSDKAGPHDRMVHLVDPSLYCCIVNVTPCVAPTILSPILYDSPAFQMHEILRAKATTRVAKSPFHESFLQWLPCELQVDENSAVAKICTYINNLHPYKFASLYDSIECIVTQLVPQLETVLSSLDREADERTLEGVYEQCNRTLPRAPRLVPRGLFHGRQPFHWLRGRQCQVVIRISEVQLTREHPVYGGDKWHSEGSDYEEIIATGVYFYAVVNVVDPKLSFRTFVKYPFHSPEDAVTLGLVYGLQSNDLLMQELGSVTAQEGRCVVFPNIHQYKLDRCRLEDPSRPGIVGMVTFMLVSKRQNLTSIVSTAVVPPQQPAGSEQPALRS